MKLAHFWLLLKPLLCKGLKMCKLRVKRITVNLAKEEVEKLEKASEEQGRAKTDLIRDFKLINYPTVGLAR